MIIEKKEFKRLVDCAAETFLDALQKYTGDILKQDLTELETRTLLTSMISGAAASFSCAVQFTYGTNVSRAINSRLSNGYAVLIKCQQEGYKGSVIEKIESEIKKGLE